MQQNLYGETLSLCAKKDAGHEFEFTLPEYLPNISRIVKSFAFVEKTDVKNDPELCFELGLKIGIVYISDFGGKIKSAVFRENVSVPLGAGIDNTEKTVIIPSAYVVSASSKPQGPRKFSCNCSYHVTVSAYEQDERKMLDEEGDEKIHTLKEHRTLCRKITLPESEFESEVQISLDSSKQNVGEIIYTDAVFCGAECSVDGSSLSFDGKFIIHTLYETDDDSEAGPMTSYAVINAPVTVSESIESGLIKEGQRAYIYLDTLMAEPSVSFDPYGENKVITLSLKYKASPVLFESYDAQIVTDAFSEEYASALQTAELALDSMKNSISTTVHLSETIKGDMRDLSEISDCTAKILAVSMEYSGGRLFALAKCRISVFGTNGQGELSGRDNVATLHIPILSEGMANGNIIPEIILSISSCDAFIREGSLVAEPEISVKGIICERQNAKVVTGLEKDTSKPCPKAKNEIVICYPSKGDTLWNIAKKYCSSPEVLKTANNLEGTDISSKHILLIP